MYSLIKFSLDQFPLRLKSLRSVSIASPNSLALLKTKSVKCFLLTFFEFLDYKRKDMKLRQQFSVGCVGVLSISQIFVALDQTRVKRT